MIFSEALAKVAQDYLHKGSKVYLEGSLQTRKWQGQDGQDRYSTEVVLQGFNAALTLLDPKPSGTSSQPSEEVAPVHGKTTPSKAPTSPPRTDWSRKPDDEIPL